MNTIELEENELELRTFTQLQPVYKNFDNNPISEHIAQNFQQAEMSKQFEKEIDALVTEFQNELIEKPHILQSGSGRVNKITFHDGKIYKLFEETYIDKEIIPNENTNNLEGVIESLKEVLPKEIETKLQIIWGNIHR